MKDVFNAYPSCSQSEYATSVPETDTTVLAVIEHVEDGTNTVRITNGLGDVLDVPESHWEEAVNLMETRYNELLDMRDSVAEVMAEMILASEFGGEKFAPSPGFIKGKGLPDYVYVKFTGEVESRNFDEGALDGDRSCLDVLRYICDGIWVRKEIRFRSISEAYLVDA